MTKPIRSYPKEQQTTVAQRRLARWKAPEISGRIVKGQNGLGTLAANDYLAWRRKQDTSTEPAAG